MGLYLTEEVTLLALRDREGTVASGAWFRQAVAGAVLAELVMRKRLAIAGAKTPVEAAKPRKPAHWFERFAGKNDYSRAVARGLVRRGILRADEDKVLLIFTRKLFPEVDPEPEREVRERLHAAIFEDGAAVEERTVVLASLAHKTGLLAIQFGRKAVRARKRHIEQLVAGELTGELAQDAINAAIVVTAVLPAIVVTVT